MAGEDKINTDGRERNAAEPLNESKDDGGPERYPQVRQDDGVEAGENRSFNPKPRQGAGDGGAPSARQDGNLGPEGDPAEGKR